MSDTQIAAAVQAINAARLACDAARLALVALAEPVDPSGECSHPSSQVQAVATFGETVYFCAVCGEQVGV